MYLKTTETSGVAYVMEVNRHPKYIIYLKTGQIKSMQVLYPHSLINHQPSQSQIHLS